MASSWERLYTATIGSGGGYEFDTGVAGITAKKHLKIILKIIPGSGTYNGNPVENNIAIRFNGDSTTGNYPIRRSNSGASDDTNLVNYGHLYSGYGGTHVERHFVADIINVASKEKLVLMEQTGTATGAGNAPYRTEAVGKWVNTSAQITDIQCHGSNFSTAYIPYGEGSTMTIWGADDQPTTDKSKDSITNVPAGTRYEETDTRKIFRRKGSAVSLTGLKAYFPMNEASGKLINKASDYGSTDAISNFDLTVTGGTQNTSGKIDKCVSFSGNQKAEAADSNLSDTAFLTNNGAAWTICFWSKVEGLASGGNIEGDQGWFSTTEFGSGENGILCRVASTVAPPNNPAYTNMQIGTLSDDRVNGTTSANGLESGGAGSGTGWHFIVLQYDDSTGIARQSKDNGAWNNAATGQNLTNTDTPSHKFRLGQWKDNSNNLNGDMEAFSIWNRVLTASEITTLYGNTTDVGQGLAPSWEEKGVA